MLMLELDHICIISLFMEHLSKQTFLVSVYNAILN